MDTHISYQKNSFDSLRYYAAFAVMLLHYSGFWLMSSNSSSSFFIEELRKVLLCFPGVVVLFTISGFLITASLERTNSKKIFFKKRIFRLFPELWICTIFNLVILSIFASDYFDRSILLWLFSQIFGIAYTPNCMKEFATGSINGALWTIFVELQLYVVTCCLYPFLKKLSYIGWGVVLVLFTAMNLIIGAWFPVLPSIGQKIVERTFLPYGIWYLILYVFVKQPGYYCGILTSIFCPLIVIGLAYWLPPFRIKLDLSYGMFLYHWMVLNIFVHFGWLSRLAWPVTLGLFIGSTLILSWLSRWLVSKCKRE